MQKPFFSIIIPVYNGLSHDLPVCLNSIWQQPLDESLYEVICVDDCSVDGTREWLDEQQQEHGNLRVIRNEINIRQGGGRNRGMRMLWENILCLLIRMIIIIKEPWLKYIDICYRMIWRY